MKNIKGFIISGIVIIILVVITIFTITQGKSNATESEDLKSKVDAELQYLDDKILSILNGLNNISLRNYSVTSQEIGQSTEETDNESSGVTKNSDETEIESSSNSNEKKANAYELSSAGILSTSKEANWETLKNEVEILYSSWSTVILDLYKLNINSEEILKFSTLLDKATMDIREENKTQALVSFANLYACIPKYIESYSTDNMKINLQRVKSSLINAYAVVESENWNEVSAQMSNAELSYLNILNSVSVEENYNINKGYILLKELQNSIPEKDKDIFYIKYKSFLEQLNNIKQY